MLNYLYFPFQSPYDGITFQIKLKEQMELKSV